MSTLRKSIAVGRGDRGWERVLVRVPKVGVDATDREINEALYGNAPEGDQHLVIGHECFGVIEEVGPNVRRVKPGDYVTATVRRPGGSIYDLIGTNDMTSEEEYYERGTIFATVYDRVFCGRRRVHRSRARGAPPSPRSDGADELCSESRASSL